MALVPPPRPAPPPLSGDTPPSSVLAGNAPEWSVGDLAAALKRTLEDRFGHVRLRGEISGYRGPHGSGHAYFSLKDGTAKIDAVVWKGVLSRLRQKPKEGLEVVVTGKITTFAGKSSYQIVVDTMEPAGIGAWMALLEERKKLLAAEGLFASERKRPIPYLPRVVGVVTSPTGAVIRDILHRLEDRFPRPVLVWPVRVQGEGAAEEIAAAIGGFNQLQPGGILPRPDVLIVARGGGSIEDLWAFNEEIVVRAAAASAIPLISAVGHETDTTLIDFAADRRAPTPTGAAEMAVPVQADLLDLVADLGRRQAGTMLRRVERERADLRALLRAIPNAEAYLGFKRQRLDLAEARLGPALAANARDARERLGLVAERLARRSPALALSRARERLARIGEAPRLALRHFTLAKSRELGYLAGRLALARGATLERARAVEARRADRLATLRSLLENSGARLIERRRDHLAAQGALLSSLSYRAVLARGYVLVRDEAGQPLRDADAARRAAILSLEFADGLVQARPEAAPEPPPRPKPAPRRSPAKAPTAARQGSLFEA
ncbi:exodeoxyribonuclease VII large subunit [Methylobacterium organophilum]|uniref:exodeoxyribonuclease VII large subunit n=1 Tax=Methylobacterium organophilum TaxID=410 RepID=UPI001F144D67|nr:exodeoxyribonuclease VII large subunit [Methylobacterium organophilum]UMY18142.1 exodeoxyribonuclease VII large subunit [Methylobacterium organophilum]